MLNNGCKYAVVECTSEGLAQNRHLGIDFDYAIFTNLSPAHIEAHGSLKNYRAAKAELFKSIGISQTGVAKKTLVVNLDDASAEYFLQFLAQQKIGITFSAPTTPSRFLTHPSLAGGEAPQQIHGASSPHRGEVSATADGGVGEDVIPYGHIALLQVRMTNR